MLREQYLAYERAGEEHHYGRQKCLVRMAHVQALA